jgi:hypothetical protein
VELERSSGDAQPQQLGSRASSPPEAQPAGHGAPRCMGHGRARGAAAGSREAVEGRVGGWRSARAPVGRPWRATRREEEDGGARVHVVRLMGYYRGL